MKVYRSNTEPIRSNVDTEERWHGVDRGLIACWERGREKSLENQALASQACDGQLVLLPWKGGAEKAIKEKKKYGTLNYLAMWQGLRGEDLSIDTDKEPTLTCTVTRMTVVFTRNSSKYAPA